MSKRDDLKKRAAELALEYPGNISNAKLAKLIKEAEAKQNSGAVTNDAEKVVGEIGAAHTDTTTAPNNGAVVAEAGGEANSAQIAKKPTQAPKTKTAAPIVLRITGPKAGRWRAGRQFGPVPTELSLDVLSGADTAALTDDPKLVVVALQDGEQVDLPQPV